MELLWWISFGDGAKSLLLNRQSLMGMCVTILGDGIELSKEQKDVDKEKVYEAGWGGRRQGNFSFGSVGETRFWFF